MPVRWEQWHRLAGVFDVAGPRSDGRLVAADAAGLVLVGRNGTEHAYAPAYSAPAGSEAYIAVAGPAVSRGPCPFVRDDVFAIQPLAAGSSTVVRVDRLGGVHPFVALPAGGTLDGVAFDEVGDLGHRLVVTGADGSGHTVVSLVDCRGTVTTLTALAPVMEGGIAVAPRSFGAFAGQLIAPDELSGDIIAVNRFGESTTLLTAAVPKGGDIGVESLGFVPGGALARGAAYTADRGTPGNPHPGTDTLLRLTGATLAAAGVRSGDLLVATEGSDLLLDVRCARTCTAREIGSATAPAHGEGHIAMAATVLAR